MRPLSIISTAAVILSIVICPTVSLAGMSKITDNKQFRIELQLETAQPVVGNNAAILTVTDAVSGRMIDNAVVDVVPWMTMHGHGSPKKPVVQKAGAGRYHVENIYYTMEGDWDLLVTVQHGDSRDATIFPVLNVKKK